MLIDTSTKSRACGRHSAFAPFFASTWLHSLRYAEVSNNLYLVRLKDRSAPLMPCHPDWCTAKNVLVVREEK